jgi:hypothetical protein
MEVLSHERTRSRVVFLTSSQELPLPPGEVALKMPLAGAAKPALLAA